ncbi:MAG: redoxin domain-containing protein [Candidatus Omnitrophota bacterium]
MKNQKILYLLIIFLLVGCAAKEKIIIDQPILDEYLSKETEVEAEELNLSLDFKLADLDGKTYLLSDYRNKQPVALFFWTSWCPHCRKELAVLNQRYAEVSKEGLELFSVNVGEADYKVANIVEKYNLTVSTLLDKDSYVSNSFGIFGIPTYILVNKKGKIVFQDNYFPQNNYKNLISE